MSGSSNIIGGTITGAGNTITGNEEAGIALASGTGDAFEENSIFANSEAPIQETGAGNNDIPAPVLKTPTVSVGGGASVPGSLPVNDSGNYQVEFFASSATGQSQTFLGFIAVSLTATELKAHTETFSAGPFTVPAGEFITATVTDSSGDTSALSNAVAPNDAEVDSSVRLNARQEKQETSVQGMKRIHGGSSRWTVPVPRAVRL